MEKDPSKVPWRPGDVFDNFAAAADAVGFKNIGVAWGLANIPYKSLDDREAILHALTRTSPNEAGN